MRNILKWMSLSLILFSAMACEGIFPEKECDFSEGTERKVLLLYSAGFNSLSSYLAEDIRDLKSGYLPAKSCEDDVLLVYSHLTKSYGRYKERTSPALLRIYKKEDIVVTDTLVVYGPETVSATAGQLNAVLDYVKEKYPAKSYGMIFSSHATGWLPSGYYTKSSDYEAGLFGNMSLFSSGKPVPVPYAAPEYDPSTPMTKSVGQEQVWENDEIVSYEINLADFVQAIPMYLDYILFDACLMGGVEVAYQLREVCGKVGFSQTEVLAEGLDYKTLTNHLLLPDEPEPEKVCSDFFAYYDALSGIERSATVSLVDCSKMESLAGLCSSLFMKYSDSIAKLNPRQVQRYYRSDYHWYYDLESILVQAGMDEQELEELHKALEGCVVYKAATPTFMGSFEINTFSGFSMFLPCDGGKRLNEFYRTLDWNLATGLVK